SDLGSVNPVLADALQKRLTGDASVADVDALADRAAARGRKAGDVKAAANVSEQVERLGETYDNSVAELHLYPARPPRRKPLPRSQGTPRARHQGRHRIRAHGPR